MKVLVSYLGRNQVFCLDDNDKSGQMSDLKQKVFSYFKTASGTKVILQRFDKDWDTYLELDDEDTLNDRDRIQAITVAESPSPKETLNSGSKTRLDDSESVVNYYIYVCIRYNPLHSFEQFNM